MMEQFDVAVVGLGVLGSASAYQAALKGAKVVAFEQFDLGHVHGASHDTSRIVRRVNAAPEYVALAKSAYEDWRTLEEATGQTLLTTPGGVFFVPKDAAGPLSDFTESMNARGVPYELLDSEEVSRRWPQFQIPDTMTTMYSPEAGIVNAARSVTCMQHFARSLGAILKEQTRVDRVTPKPSGTGVTIKTSNGEFHASKVILTTDAWANELLAPLGVHIPLSVMQEQVTYFKPTNVAAFEPDRFPIWIWYGDPCYYGFPCYGEPTIKAGRDVANNFMTPAQRTYVHSPQLLEQLSSHLDSTIPDRGRQTLRTVTCQYTITPDRRFIISPLREYGNIIIGLGAAHAFKFAPAFGRVLAELAIEGKTDEDISKFGLPKVDAVHGKL